ncbi:MAG TPA: hypothetical protein VH413_12800 [Verrucomicrobiae bacterium]|jgi:hypothetical protein|nr:hypothetical protein [Verrucomicrobiae bacterium]
MRLLQLSLLALFSVVSSSLAEDLEAPFSTDPGQILERTCFQTSKPWSSFGNLRADVALVYGIDASLPERIQTWRDHGYRIHVMTGVAWGNYQDYFYGRFDGISHEDEAQTERNGNKIGHGGDVYYMCPGTNYGKFLCVGVQRALDSGAEAIHLEEPEFWVRGGYSEGFKREWQNYYGEAWQPPNSSVDAQWRSSKLKYFLYRRALQQVFDYVQDFNHRTGKKVRCYVPTHSLLNYAQWGIVSPESSLARLNGCDGYIAQVWTGTSREPNRFRGEVRSRTFETAFLEYGAMQNLVRATGRRVWYLNDPIEDNPNHDWNDYQRNWESTLVASLFQPEVSHYEIAPWPERIFNGRYPRSASRENRKSIPPAYATELQTVMNTLNDLDQKEIEWDCGTRGVGVLASDSLMFERGDPTPSDPHLSQMYGLAMPLLKRGLPVTPVQLENVTAPDYLQGFKVLLLTYQGMKPLDPEYHNALAKWVKQGGVLVVCDDDSDPYNRVRDWWNSGTNHYATPREHLFERLDFKSAVHDSTTPTEWKCGRGKVIWARENPARLAASVEGDETVVRLVKQAAADAKLKWRETNYLLLRRGPYVIAAGLDESVAGDPKVLSGHFVNLFDSELRMQTNIQIEPGKRYFLRDLDAAKGRQPQILASAARALVTSRSDYAISFAVEGVADTPGLILLRSPQAPKSITQGGQVVQNFEYSPVEKLLRIRFTNQSQPVKFAVSF